MNNDGSPPPKVYRGTRGSSQPNKQSVPRPESRIQKIPTKDPTKQYYSQQILGGWRILNANEAAKQMRREHMTSKRNAESIRHEGATQSGEVRKIGMKLEKASPPTKKRKSDYLRLIAVFPSDRQWKSWENKHLLRSYANGSSFAQIASSHQFSDGFVIRNEAECRARFEVLHQWQPFQDAELLRVGSFGVDQDFARTCAEKFSRGMVKRSEKQCKERYEFLVKGEFERPYHLQEGNKKLTASL